MITVHLVFNAHIDPVWLWPWPSGVDTLLATCRSACDHLDRHPDLHFTRAEAWAYREIERLDSVLFDRIRRHVEAGRWHIVGGWWLQPDCNGPSGVGLEQQIRLGKEYFLDRFGFFPRIAYNVDSFGHAASLPGLMRAAGQDRYVFMRPQEHEMQLPARVFRWRGHEDGPEVVAFRIARSYTTREITIEHVKACLQDLPDGIEHTMCFVGVGDHGGGPTERQIAWCQEHRSAIEGCSLIFSSPAHFFDAIADRIAELPVVTGELQSHSVGCYSVHRAVKVGVHRAEHALVQAEIARQHDPQPEPQTAERIDDAWRWVCFAHFHDIFGGTCIPSAYEQVHARLGWSCATADEIIQHGLRRRLNSLPDDPLQRIALFNASDSVYDGYVICDPSIEDQQWQPHWRLVDENGEVVPHQRMNVECLVPEESLFFLRLLFRVKLEPGQVRTLRIDRRAGAGRPVKVKPCVEAKARRKQISTDHGVAVLAGEGEGLRFRDGSSLPLPRLDLIDDPTDTWTHEVDRYGQVPLASARWRSPRVVDAGPLMASCQQEGRIGRSDLLGEYRVYADEPFVEWLLRVYWTERHKVLKLTLPMPSPLGRRHDGIPGGQLVRQPDGAERPVRDRTLLELADRRRVGLVFPDVYALDGTPGAVRLTLLRSPKMAHHYPYHGKGPRGLYADQGVHDFRFRFFCGPGIAGLQLDQQALMMHRPPVVADLTRGMPPY